METTEYQSILDEHGIIPMEQIRNFETLYLDTETRMAQDNFMMYKYLLDTLTKEAKAKAMIYKTEWHVGKTPSDLLLLAVVIRESSITTNATIASLRTKLSSLDHLIIELGGGIDKFNSQVKLDI